ncbi:hypothetical protein GIB67_016057 [Kingdonia uniflora]|uniref:Uncharacterized protein n=1 Tax=Kingdonia uniflora TaxID=39325 RepID=A0A7J7L1U4_9MAGN|nr:hypothetical protein GIB67_016057 [Kingdonia uniflora]
MPQGLISLPLSLFSCNCTNSRVCVFEDLPGFYYDPVKNRYFPIKGPIPGSKRASSSSASSSPLKLHKVDDERHDVVRKGGNRAAKLLQARELYGKVLSFEKGKCSFKHEYHKIQASLPVIWKYENTDSLADSALEELHVDLQTPEGQYPASVLLLGSVNGYLSLGKVGKVGEYFEYRVNCVPYRVWPPITELQAGWSNVPKNIWTGAVAPMTSAISCIKTSGGHSLYPADDHSFIQHALITTLGSETSKAAVYILKLNEPLDFSSSVFDLRTISHVASMSSTIWTADCNPDGSQAVIGKFLYPSDTLICFFLIHLILPVGTGTNQGASLINLETGGVSWVCRSKSDIFSQQFDQTGNIVLCGFRNGAILTVDVRQKQQEHATRLPKHLMPSSSHAVHDPSNRNLQNMSKRGFEVRGNINSSCTVCMPSSVSSLVSLRTYDQYFLASSMDGSMKLYDHRMIDRGAIQSYEGHVNSHTRIQLGVDPSEEHVMSGGEDGKVRIWSIKTGELLFETKISNSVPSTICWPRTEKLQGLPIDTCSYEENLYEHNHSWGAWLGSRDELFYMHGR